MATDSLQRERLELVNPHVARPRPAPSLAPPAGAADPMKTPSAKALSALTVASREHEDLVVIALGGQFDIYTAPDFWEHVRRHDPAEVQLVIDLTQVGLLDSAGIGGLLSLRNRVHRAGAQLGLVCSNRHLTRLFRATGLRPAFVFGNDLTAVRDVLARRRPVHLGPAHAPGR